MKHTWITCYCIILSSHQKPCPHMPSWYAQTQLYLYFTFYIHPSLHDRSCRYFDKYLVMTLSTNLIIRICRQTDWAAKHQNKITWVNSLRQNLIGKKTFSEKLDMNATFIWMIASEDFTPYSPIKALYHTPMCHILLISSICMPLLTTFNHLKCQHTNIKFPKSASFTK